MKPNFWKIGTIILVGVLLIGGIIYSYRSVRISPEADVSQFINKDSYVKAIEECHKIGSKDRLCTMREPYERVDTYCKDNSLSKNDCDEVKVRVTRKGLEFHNQFNDQMANTTEKIQQMTDKLKREQLRKSQ